MTSLGSSSPLQPSGSRVIAILDKRFDENDKLQYLVQNADETTWIHDKELYREDDPTTCTCPAVLSAFEDGHDDSKAGSANLSSELPRLNEYARIYDRGLHAIIREFYKKEKDNALLSDRTYMTNREHILLILAAMPEPLLREIIGGSVQRRKFVDRSFRLLLESYERGFRAADKAGFRPSKYMLEYTDSHGRPPTVAEAHDILDLMQKYLNDWQYAVEIDQVDLVDVDQRIEYISGHRKRATADGTGTILSFVNQSRDWLFRYNANRFSQEYMPQPFRLAGYTGYPHNPGQDQQRTDTTSLLDSIAARSFNAKWRMRLQCIFHCFAPGQAADIELLLASAASTPPGYSWRPAGTSLNSANSIDRDVYAFFEEGEWKKGVIIQRTKAEEQLLLERERRVAEMKARKQELERQLKQEDLEILRLKVAELKVRIKIQDEIIGPFA